MDEAPATKNRIAVQLPAQLSIHQSQEIPCVIEEVGLEEATVRLDRPPSGGVATGAVTTLSFRIPDANSETVSRVPAQVVIGDGNRFVLAFEVPDQSAVRALNDWASSRQSSGTRQPGFDSRRSHELFAACRLAARRFFDDRLPDVLEQSREILFERAHKASSHIQQAEAFDAMQEAERLMPAIRSGFFDGFELKMDKLWSAVPGNEVTEPGNDDKHSKKIPEALSLIDTGSFNDWLLMVQIITRAQRLVTETERALCSRLCQLLPRPVETSQLPFGLEGSCSIFHDSLQNLGALKVTRHALLVGFEVRVVKCLPALYDELNAILGTAGVEPVKEKLQIRPAPEGPRRGSPAIAPDAEPRQFSRDGPPGAEFYAEGAPLPPAAERRPGEAGAPAPAPDPAGEAGPTVPLAPGADTASPQGPAATPIWDRDVYRTARKLVRLTRGPLSRTAAAAPADAELISAESVADVGQVLEALAQVELPADPVKTGEFGALGLAQRVGDSLSAADVELGDGTADLVNIISDFIDVMLADPLVHPEARGRIRRLAIPLLRTALTGDPFFGVGPHPARQLLDALGVIHPGPDDEVFPRIDAAIEAIVRDPSPSRRVYAAALAEIGPIAEGQRQALAARMEQVAATCEAQQSTLESLRSSDAEPAESGDPGERHRVPALFRKSLARTDRLSVGETLVLDADHFAPRPATLCWKSNDSQKFAFVTHAGLEAVSFTRRALAMELHRERIRTVEGSELALTERALCHRLYALHQQVKTAATHDTLTGLVNRKHFNAEVKNSLDRADRKYGADHLCLVQADGFESIVRKFGRKASKQLLVKLADMLSRQIGNAGIACRIKAHRFGVLIYSGDQDEASSYLQRFRRSVEEARCVLKGESFFLTVSGSVVTLDRETQDLDTAMSLAETALLAAAGAGGNRVEVVPEATAATEPEIVSAGETNISEFIEQGRLFLRAQRIHPLKLSPVHTYHEILLGVRGPDGATLPPGPIVATAERRGQVGELDRWVIREALTWMMAAPERLAHAAGYSLNLSGVTLSDESLIHDILELLSSTRVPPGKVIFEITETAGIDSLPTARNFLSSLQGQGCKFSLDDFGVGHASFAYLRSLPVDKIKIDGMFIKDLALNPNDRAVVQSITEVAHFMGRHTVAEFVENDEILRIVREIGVDYAQGYGIEKPRAIDELILPPPPLALFDAGP